MYSTQHALDETNSSDDDKKKNPAIRKLVYSQYRYQGNEQKGIHSNHDFFVVVGKQCRTQNA